MIEREEDQQEQEQYFTEREKCEAVLGVLLQLRDNGPDEHDCGICNHLDEGLITYTDAKYPDYEDDGAASDELFQYVEDHKPSIYHTWPDYTGDELFPIASDCPLETPYEAYQLHSNNHTLWDDTEYGNARRDLLDHMIKYYETELEKHNAG
jgi:hypothetical protein